MTLVKYAKPTPSIFDNFFDGFFDDFVTKDAQQIFNPRVDIAESDKNFHLEIALPGLKKEEVSIEHKDDYLVITGERKFENKEETKKYKTVETQYGKFSRTFHLPKLADAENVKAELKDGILKIDIPKIEEQKQVKTIQIK